MKGRTSMKRTIALITAAVMIFSLMPVYASKSLNTVYDMDFENSVTGFSSDSAEVKISDGGMVGKCVSLGGYEKREDAPRIVLKDLAGSAASEISVCVKAQEESANVKMYASLNCDGTQKEYLLASAKVNNTEWTNLSGKMMTRLMSVTGSPEIVLVAENNGKFVPIFADNFVVKSDVTKESTEIPVPKISYDGNFTIRHSFETGTAEKLMRDRYAVFKITDDTTPHSGRKVLKISDRTSSTSTLRYDFDKSIDLKSTVQVSAYIKNLADDKEKRYYAWQIKIPTAEKTHWVMMGSGVNLTNKEWGLVSGSVDLSKYEVTGTPMIQIVATKQIAGKPYYYGFYVDDFVFKTNTKGELYDDLNYVPKERDKSLSATPTERSLEEMNIQTDIPSLKDVYKDYFKVGACIWSNQESDTTPYGKLLKKHFNAYVSDGVMKIQSYITKNADGTLNYDYTAADKFMNWCVGQGQDVIGHALIWETTKQKIFSHDTNGNPLDRDSVLSVMKEVIQKTIRHFEGDGEAEEYTSGYDTSNWHVYVWDVINESVVRINPDGSIRFQNWGVWYDIVGRDYINYAFKYAKDAGYDDIKLRINDFNEHEKLKLEGYYTLVKELKAEGVPVDVVGFQSHYYSNQPVVNGVRNALEKFSSLGVEVHATELDIQALTLNERDAGIRPYENGITKRTEFDIASTYAELFKVYKEYSDTVSLITFWTFSDEFMYYEIRNNCKEYAGIFDKNSQAKPQYWAIADPDKFYSEILDEDTSKIRLRVETHYVDDDNIDGFVKDGVPYVEAKLLLKYIGGKCAVKGDTVKFIRNGIYCEMTAESSAKTVDFKPLTADNAPVKKDGKIYLPVEEVSTDLGYETLYNPHRNVVQIYTTE